MYFFIFFFFISLLSLRSRLLRAFVISTAYYCCNITVADGGCAQKKKEKGKKSNRVRASASERIGERCTSMCKQRYLCRPPPISPDRPFRGDTFDRSCCSTSRKNTVPVPRPRFAPSPHKRSRRNHYDSQSVYHSTHIRCPIMVLLRVRCSGGIWGRGQLLRLPQIRV